MGYTHSWYRNRIIAPYDMIAIKSDFDMIVEKLPAESAIKELPEYLVGYYDVAFRGTHGSAEDFVFTEQSTGRVISNDGTNDPSVIGKCFEFCKTERLPYDLAVCCFLIIAKKYLGENIRIQTDGSQKDWKAAMGLCRQVVGYGKDCLVSGGVVTRA